MLSIFEFTNYRQYLTAWIAAQGDRSYGLKGKLAAASGVSSSLISQILGGEKSLTPDQASDAVDFLGLSEIESEYFHLMVEKDRAANPRYREKISKKMLAVQKQSLKIGTRVPRNKELNDQQKAIYYSSWLYTGIRNMTAISGLQQANSIAEHLRCEPQLVTKILRFLIENGLCREENNLVTYGPASTHIDKESPFVNKHHQNWRFQAINTMEKRRDGDIFFTSPMSLSKAATKEIEKMIPQFIQSVMKISGPSESEQTQCLNIDWFNY
jgi:uncharacterized protein (TIGR02147 family)